MCPAIVLAESGQGGQQDLSRTLCGKTMSPALLTQRENYFQVLFVGDSPWYLHEEAAKILISLAQQRNKMIWNQIYVLYVIPCTVPHIMPKQNGVPGLLRSALNLWRSFRTFGLPFIGYTDKLFVFTMFVKTNSCPIRM